MGFLTPVNGLGLSFGSVRKGGPQKVCHPLGGSGGWVVDHFLLGNRSAKPEKKIMKVGAEIGKFCDWHGGSKERKSHFFFVKNALGESKIERRSVKLCI